MTEFHEGQEVEVLGTNIPYDGHFWRKAKIIYSLPTNDIDKQRYRVEFAGGSRAIIDADHMRPAEMVWMP